MKQIIVLVGPKGSGKSTIGDLLATELGIHFLRVEPLFLGVRTQFGASHPQYEQHGFDLVLKSLRDALQQHDTVCFETTGASAHVPWLLSDLEKHARVLAVHILLEPDQCLERIRGRDASIHMPVSDDQVERINAIATKVVLPWAAEIDNRGAFNRASVLSTVRSLLDEEIRKM
jgi:shikimate kinase